MSAICKSHVALAFGQSLMPTAPAFDFYEPSFYEQVVKRIYHDELFERLHGDLFRYRGTLRIEGRADGWIHGYDDNDVARTPAMCRSPLHPLFGFH